MRREEFEYELPDDRIAQRPIEPRDAARLLDTTTMTDRVFAELPDVLRTGDLVVVNTTRVRTARLEGRKRGTGGAVELLLLERGPDAVWTALVSPARRIRAGTLIDVDGACAEVLTDPEDGIVRITLDDESVVDRAGRVPLPPYIHEELADPGRYQTVYADQVGSAAAPTAGLHFTPGVLSRLAASGIERADVELRVGIGTFRPISAERVEDHRMHAEWCTVPDATAAAVERTRDRGGRVVAIGTTSVRTLESFARDDGTVEAGTRVTDLFLMPGSRFRATDALVTNFHVPGSSLLVMLAGFMGERWRPAYETALERGYRFLSFGDAMYCERA